VLLDEPAAGLSELERNHLSVIIKWLAHDLHVAVLLVEHDVALVSKVSDRVLALEMGKNVITGKADEVLADRRVIQSYIGTEVELAVEQTG
jgi:ABC-type branched-subunit amino acid transport system ATPase component